MAVNQARRWQENYTSNVPKVEKRKVIIRKKSWITKGEKILYAIVGICLIISAALTVTFSSTTDTLNRELQSLEQDVQAQRIKNDELKFEVDELSRPGRIIGLAKENGFKIQSAKVKRANAYNKK